ncbi:MAG: hypothetical protein JW798_17740 [Prolixibacteraceae bacterium]|nr:hypothetical protein [Prolixibacteraceae bacterium]
MKRIKLFLITALSVLVFWGCDEDLGDDDVPQVYFVDFEELNPEGPIALESIQKYWDDKKMSDIAEIANYEIRIFKLVYKTTFEGKSQQVSGLLAAPVAIEKNDRFPIMSYQHKTITKKDACPTADPDGEIYKFISYLASTGMVVLIPDYIGFGESENFMHPYMCKEYMVNPVVDFIKASREFIFNQDPCEINDKLFLAGYSEGAVASLATLSAIETGSENLGFTVSATACGAGIYDLNYFREWMVNQPKYDQPYVIAYILESYSMYHGLNIDYSEIFVEQVAAAIPGMFEIDKSVEEHNSDIEGVLGTLHIGELYNDDFEDIHLFNSEEKYSQLKLLMEQNSIEAWNLNSDVTFYYGEDDGWVPSNISLDMYRKFREAGATEKVKIDAIDDVDHNEALIPVIKKAIQRFRQY